LFGTSQKIHHFTGKQGCGYRPFFHNRYHRRYDLHIDIEANTKNRHRIGISRKDIANMHYRYRWNSIKRATTGLSGKQEAKKKEERV
jgi:hypothetical protein